jgi:hypothetical protein
MIQRSGMSARPPRPSRPFSGIDGESYTVEGEHRYVLLMESTGAHIFEPNGLGTKQCFDFLLSLPKKKIYVAFGLNYDVNMMLVDFGKARLKELWTDGECLWFGYKIEWIPGKWFRIKKGNDSIRIDEVFGFFQTSFLRALEKWKIPPQDQAMIEKMKGSRSVFDDGMRKQLIEYCHLETVLTNQLMEAVRGSTKSVGLQVQRWNGAGAIAASILKRGGVKDHIVRHDDLEKEVQYATLKAYFGGRTELFQQGRFRRLYQYDIVSAYPYAAISLPSLTKGYWKYEKTYNPQWEHAIWHVRWRITDPTISPFPYRYKGARICYPSNGEGWYHACELRAALSASPSGGIDVLDGYVFHCANSDRPFYFVPLLAAEKVKYKRKGHGGEKILKLGLNAMYGKLAQGKGYKDTIPPYQSFFWAGEITARTRARMLELAHLSPENVVMIATDGIFYKEDPRVRFTDELGGLDKTILSDCFTAQPGVYRAFTDDGTEIRKSRGFFAKEIDFEQLEQGFTEQGPYFIGNYLSTRFVGLGTALMSKDMGHWRSWQKKTRKLTLHPSVKRLLDSESRPVLHLPPILSEPVVPSAPYTPKGAGYLEDEEDAIQGKEQPLKV